MTHYHGSYPIQLSLRDYFAGQALIGLAFDERLTSSRTAEWAYDLADAMISERSKDKSKEDV